MAAMVDRGYCRISLDTKASGSIEKQKSQIAGRVQSKGNDSDDIAWYVDESKSGAIPMRNRPSGSQLWREVEAGDVVYVSKIDRAARSVTDLLATVEHIESVGASIVFVSNDIDTSGPTGRLLLTILGAVAEFERSLIAERRTESIIAARSDGRHIVGKAPTGFTSEPRSDGRGLKIVPDREPDESGTSPADQVREAVMRVLRGESQESVRDSLGMSRTGFRTLLCNPRLAGMTPEGESVVTINGVPRVDTEAAILSMAEWQLLSEHMEERAGKPWTRNEGYGAALSCGTCGERLYFQKDKRKPEYATYKCRGARHGKGERYEGKPGVSVMAHNADEYLEQTFLAEHGDRPYVVGKTIMDDADRSEAVAVAQVAVQEAQSRLTLAETEDAEGQAFSEFQAAKRALRDAEAMPGERRWSMVETGETVAEVFTHADHETRCAMLRSVATWNVLPGRMPIDVKIVQDEPEGGGIAMKGSEAAVHIPVRTDRD